MKDAQWAAVDDYVGALMFPPDAALQAALDASAAAELPPIAVSAAQGKLLQILAGFHGVTSVLEIGTLGGYSTICLARAVSPGGKVVTLELEPKHAEVATANFALAGLADMVDVRLGRATDTLESMVKEQHAPFDLVFIDADKQSIPEYFTYALQLTRKGSLIIVDNVIRDGAVVDATSTDPSVVGVRRFNEMVSQEPRVTATTIQTVGAKGWDGLTFVLVSS